MSTFDLTCPESFAEAFKSLPDSPDKPSIYRIDGAVIEIAYVRNDGSAVANDGRWLDTETMRKAEKLG